MYLSFQGARSRINRIAAAMAWTKLAAFCLLLVSYRPLGVF